MKQFRCIRFRKGELPISSINVTQIFSKFWDCMQRGPRIFSTKISSSVFEAKRFLHVLPLATIIDVRKISSIAKRTQQRRHWVYCKKDYKIKKPSCARCHNRTTVHDSCTLTYLKFHSKHIFSTVKKQVYSDIGGLRSLASPCSSYRKRRGIRWQERKIGSPRRGIAIFNLAVSSPY